MANNSKRSPRRGKARAADGTVQLHPHNSSAGSCEQHGSYTDDLPFEVVLIVQRGDDALVAVNGLPMVWDARGLAWLRAHGHVRCMCGRCGEAVLQ